MSSNADLARSCIARQPGVFSPRLLSCPSSPDSAAIFQLCGFGYYLDLCFAQLGGLIGGQIQQELGVSNSRIGDLSTCFSAGMTVGALFWGLAVDIIGRRWAFNITVSPNPVSVWAGLSADLPNLRARTVPHLGGLQPDLCSAEQLRRTLLPQLHDRARSRRQHREQTGGPALSLDRSLLTLCSRQPIDALITLEFLPTVRPYARLQFGRSAEHRMTTL